MNIFTVAAFALLSCCAAVILKKNDEPISSLVAVSASIVIICGAVASLTPVIEFVRSLDEGGEYSIYYTTMLKGLGIAMLAESASDICKECGEISLGTKVELAAKVSMLILSLPILEAIISLSKEMMSK